MSQEFDMKIDILHALKDFLDAYDNHAVMLVTEAIANAIDVGAAKIAITLKESAEGEKTISFYNNGPSMSKEEFDNYHVLARSSKSKGKGIGFAGIGAKVYLAAWQHAVIYTETTDGKTAFSSEMYVRNSTLKARYTEPKLKKPGTLYTVCLKDADYNFLEKGLNDIVEDTFSPAMADKLKIRVNGKELKAWNPPHEFRKSFTVIVKDKKFPVRLSVTKDDIEDKKTYFQYHVSGKLIVTKKPEWIYDIRPAYKKRIHVYVNALRISNHLNLNKTNFKTGNATNPTFKEIDRRVFDLLQKNNYTEKQILEKFERTALTRFFEKLFKDPKYAFLNPNSRGGVGPGEGRGREGKTAESEGDTGKKQSDSAERGNSDSIRSGGGAFSAGFAPRPDDPRDGWLDPSTNKIMINIDHPLFIKYENNMQARNQRIANILTSVLIKNATSRKPMDPTEAFELQSELLIIAKDAVW